MMTSKRNHSSDSEASDFQNKKSAKRKKSEPEMNINNGITLNLPSKIILINKLIKILVMIRMMITID